MTEKAPLICQCISADLSLEKLVSTYCLDWNAIIICRSVAIKHRLYQYFRDSNAKITPLCLTAKELRYFYETYPPRASESIEKFVLQNCLVTRSFRKLPKPLLETSNIVDPFLQLIKQAQKETATLPQDCQRIYNAFQADLPDLLLPLNTDSTYWKTLSRLIKGKRLVCIGFYEWSATDQDFFNGCRDYITELRFILAYHPLNKQHDFISPFYNMLVDSGASVQVSGLANYTQSTSLYTATSPEDELQFVCQSILKKLQNKVDPKDIGIVLPDLNETRHLLFSYANALGIPLSLSVGTSFIESPIALFLRDFLSVLETKDTLIFNKNSLSRRFKEDPNLLSKQLDTFPTLSPFKAYQDALLTLFKTAGLTEQLQHIDPDTSIAQHHCLAQFQDSLDELSEIYTSPLPRKDALQLIDFLIRNLEIRPLPDAQNVIQVYSKKEALNCYKSTLYVCGFQEGKWPERLYKSPFLTNQEHQNLRLQTSQQHYLFHLYLFDILQHQCQDLVLSYSAHYDDNETSPSHLIRFCPKVTPIHTYELIRERDRDYQVYLGQYLATQAPSSLDDLRVKNQFNARHYFSIKKEAYWGILNSDQSLIALDQFFAEKPLSATKIDGYQSCPYAYFYSELLRFKEEDPLVASLNHSDWGTLVHDLLQHSLEESSYPNKSVLLKHCNASLKRSNLDPFATQVARLKLEGRDSRPGVIDWFLEDNEQLPPGFSPLHFEYSIEGEAPYFLLDLNGESLKIRGTIDVIYGNSTGAIFIIDYKTGSKTPSGPELLRYEKCQLPLYLAAFLQQHTSYRAAALVYHQLNKVDKHGIQIKLCHPDEKEAILGKTRKRPTSFDDSFFSDLYSHLKQITRLQKSGYFSPEPHEFIPNNKQSHRQSACKNCAHKLVCRFKNRFKGDRG